MTRDARAAFVRATGIFIFYITHCANDYSKENKRQTIFTSDILQALKELGFEDYEKPLEDFLEMYRKETDNKKLSAGSKIKNDNTTNNTDNNNNDENNNDDEEEINDDLEQDEDS